MPGHSRTKGQRENDLVRIAEMHAQDMSQSEIAAALSVTQQQISHDLKEIYRRWAEPNPKKLGVIKARLLTEIRLNKKIMRQAWRDSLKPKETASKKQVSTPGGVVAAGEDARPDRERNEASLKTEERDGNVAFMREVREYISLEIKLHGLNAPEQLAVTDGGAPIKFIEIHRPASVPPPPIAPIGTTEASLPEGNADAGEAPPIIPKIA
jgi:predicted DNA-binding protein YlxM (UPF0122 family)